MPPCTNHCCGLPQSELTSNDDTKIQKMVTNFGRRFRLTTTSAHWLDYGSVTLAGVPGYLLDRLQSVLYMLQHVWLRESASTIQSLLCFGTCTGCGSQNALNINWPCFNWPCWFTVVVTTPRPSTWPGTSTGSPTTTLDDVCDRQHSSSRSLGRDSAQSAFGPFKSPVLVCGMRRLHRSSLLRH